MKSEVREALLQRCNERVEALYQRTAETIQEAVELYLQDREAQRPPGPEKPPARPE